MIEQSVLFERWSGRRRVRIVPVDIDREMVAWTTEDAMVCLEKIEADRRTLAPARGSWGPGWFGHLSYDLGPAILTGRPRSNGRGVPYLMFRRAGAIRVERPLRAGDGPGRIPASQPASRTDTRASYARKILAAQEELRRGNVFEVNLSQRWVWAFERAPDEVALFARLCRAMRPAYGFFERTPGGTILSFSPELFFSVRAGSIVTEPIKGTAGPADRGLLRSAKDRAELLMITDLFRNDLGKICAPGSIHADGPKEMRLPYLRHLFSRVRGRLKGRAGLPEIIAALFPSGSVTGAPKIAACEIIDRIEPFDRAESFGAAGWVGRDRMEFAVTIRTALLRGRRLRYTAGGGITVYSDPRKEYEESLLKAGRFMEGLRTARQPGGHKKARPPRTWTWM